MRRGEVHPAILIDHGCFESLGKLNQELQPRRGAGAAVRDVVKFNVLLTRASDVATMNRLYAEAFGPAPYPA